MKTFPFSVCLLLLLACSCEKEENRPDCEINNYGTIKIENQLDESYRVFVNGENRGSITANKTVELVFEPIGIKTIELAEIDWIFFQDVQTFEVLVKVCQTEEVVLR